LITIRPETPEDAAVISEINREAFGGDTEPNLVRAIRESEHFIPELSLVAELDGETVGHILFSRISVHDSDQVHSALSLAPMAVIPPFQRRGIGTQLVKYGLEECRRLNNKIVVVIGHPDYYPRFGFKPARDYDLELEFEVPDEAFMVIELEDDALKDVRGVVKYPPAFDTAS
jgi:putative acetyltransferase